MVDNVLQDNPWQRTRVWLELRTLIILGRFFISTRSLDNSTPPGQGQLFLVRGHNSVYQSILPIPGGGINVLDIEEYLGEFVVEDLGLNPSYG